MCLNVAAINHQAYTICKCFVSVDSRFIPSRGDCVRGPFTKGVCRWLSHNGNVGYFACSINRSKYVMEMILASWLMAVYILFLYLSWNHSWCQGLNLGSFTVSSWKKTILAPVIVWSPECVCSAPFFHARTCILEGDLFLMKLWHAEKTRFMHVNFKRILLGPVRHVSSRFNSVICCTGCACELQVKSAVINSIVDVLF